MPGEAFRRTGGAPPGASVPRGSLGSWPPSSPSTSRPPTRGGTAPVPWPWCGSRTGAWPPRPSASSDRLVRSSSSPTSTGCGGRTSRPNRRSVRCGPTCGRCSRASTSSPRTTPRSTSACWRPAARRPASSRRVSTTAARSGSRAPPGGCSPRVCPTSAGTSTSRCVITTPSPTRRRAPGSWSRPSRRCAPRRSPRRSRGPEDSEVGRRHGRDLTARSARGVRTRRRCRSGRGRAAPARGARRDLDPHATHLLEDRVAEVARDRATRAHP